MADLRPHPLISEVAEGLIDSGVALESAPARQVRLTRAIGATQPPAVPRGQLRRLTRDGAEALVRLARSPDVPEVVTFAGYVGPTIRRPDTRKWLVFYLDTRLQSSLLVRTDGILYRDPVKSDDAPCGIRDVLWVKADAPVAVTNASQALESQFLTGEFTRAGDFDDTPRGGGTVAAATGVFCEARTVGCCTRYSLLVTTRPRYC